MSRGHDVTYVTGEVSGVLCTDFVMSLTFVGEGDLSSDRVDEEHLTGGNPGRLLHQVETQLGVGCVTVVAVQRLHLHERDP